MAIPYKTLEPSAFGETVTIDSNFVGLGGSLVLVIVTTGVLLAIFFRFVPAIYGFMSGDNESKRTEAKKNFWAGLLGVGFILLLIPFATSINKTIGQFSLSANSSATTPSTNTGGNTGTTPSNPGTTPGTTNPPITGSAAFLQTTNGDASIRQMLTNAKIGVNNPVCTFEGASNCTSLGGASSATIDMLMQLKQKCPSCDITVTGGTEYWAHSRNTYHYPGGRNGSPSAVDLRKNANLDNFLKNNNEGGFLPGGDRCYVKYSWGGFIFCDEKNTAAHWHVGP